MNSRQKITLYLFLTIVSGGVAFAQVVDIPDPNLRAAIADALDVPHGAPITQADMRQLTSLNAAARQITNLAGLEYATNLTELRLGENPITDISPLAHLTQLGFLRLNDCRTIDDISPLAHLTQLTVLDLDRNLIVDIGPLAGLTALTSLDIRSNQIENLSPLANLTQLTQLLLSNNKIVDISPLINLTQLTQLLLNNNKIVDISPLTNLTQLTQLLLNNNTIKDVRPLVTLMRLEVLHIQWNSIVEHSPIDGLSLSDFLYDQTCEIPPLPLAPRLANRDYPNVAGANWIFGQDPRIDLIYGNLLFQMHPRADGRLTGDFVRGLKERDEFIAANPNAVFLTALNDTIGAGERQYWQDWQDKSPHYWIRDPDGNRLIDFTHPEVQDIIVQQAISVSKCGLFDGIIFDYWQEDQDLLHGYVSLEAQLQARINIMRRIRAATRPNFLIQVNSNYDTLAHTGDFINGLSMETGLPHHRWQAPEEREEFVTLAENTLIWAEENMREPRINAIFGEALPPDKGSRSDNFQWVRLITTLSLTHSDGYAMMQNLPKDDGHWHNFWDADLGQPVSAKRLLYQDIDGLFIREFTNGWAVYNHSGSPQAITLPEEAQGVASGLVNTEHALANLDGEMYLREKPKNPADVNDDGVVNILDLTLVAQALGTDSKKGDVNGDGVVNILDLVFVADQF